MKSHSSIGRFQWKNLSNKTLEPIAATGAALVQLVDKLTASSAPGQLIGEGVCTKDLNGTVLFNYNGDNFVERYGNGV